MNRMMHSFRAAQRMLRVPLALEPGRARNFMDGLEILLAAKPGAYFDDGPMPSEVAPETDDNYLIINGVAVIEIRDVLFQNQSDCWWGGQSYDAIAVDFNAALNNPDVKAISLAIDSPGGEVAGCFDLADMIYQARGTKPIHAILQENAYSAGYALASAADVVSIPQTGGAGSIGVIAMFPDLSKMLNEFGITINVIQFGARKADGNPVAPMPEEARGAFQDEINVLGQIFVDQVARNRGMKAREILAMQAGCFRGAGAVEAGLADMVASPLAAFRELQSKIN
jgi:signal peptide peptidase SppA